MRTFTNVFVLTVIVTICSLGLFSNCILPNIHAEPENKLQCYWAKVKFFPGFANILILTYNQQIKLF